MKTHAQEVQEYVEKNKETLSDLIGGNPELARIMRGEPRRCTRHCDYSGVDELQEKQVEFNELMTKPSRRSGLIHKVASIGLSTSVCYLLSMIDFNTMDNVNQIAKGLSSWYLTKKLGLDEEPLLEGGVDALTVNFNTINHLDDFLLDSYLTENASVTINVAKGSDYKRLKHELRVSQWLTSHLNVTLRYELPSISFSKKGLKHRSKELKKVDKLTRYGVMVEYF